MNEDKEKPYDASEFKKRLEGAVISALHNLSPCPRYDNCATARATSKSNCMIYGCNVEQEHSALYQICQNMGINGDRKRRVMVIGRIRQEVAEKRY